MERRYHNKGKDSEDSNETSSEDEAQLIANVKYTQYSSVKEVLSNIFGFELSTDEVNTQWDLLWADTGVNSHILSKMKPYQKVNHFPAMYCISRKNHLGRNLMRLRRVLPKDYSYFPQTWLLPSEGTDFRKAFVKNRTFILKPEALSQGKGIFLTNTWEGIDQKEHYVAQRYIRKPFLLDGLKFDLRIYALVYGCDPLRIYVYHEGLARLATETYISPNSENLENPYIHLTNYAINKNSTNFVFNSDPDKADIGHKRNLAFVWKYIDSHGGDSAKLKEEINGIIVKTLCSIQPLLAHSYRSAQPLDASNSKCFEILGFDIILDHKLKPWLLEVNHSPSFTTDTPFDEKIKFQLLEDTIRLLNIDVAKRVKFYKKQAAKHKSRLTKEQWLEKKQRKMQKRDKYEMEHLGGYTRIYPDGKNDEYYDKLILTAKEVWEGFTGAKRKKELMQKREERKEVKPLPGKKNNIVPKNRKPLYYIKEPIAKKEEILPEQECEIGGEEPQVVSSEKPSPLIRDDIVDAIARKYNITVDVKEEENTWHLPAIRNNSSGPQIENNNPMPFYQRIKREATSPKYLGSRHGTLVPIKSKIGYLRKPVVEKKNMVVMPIKLYEPLIIINSTQKSHSQPHIY